MNSPGEFARKTNAALLGKTVASADVSGHAVRLEFAERGNSAAMREALEKLKEAYFENDDGFARIDCSIVPDFEGLIDAALAAPARNCDRYDHRYWPDEFEKHMGKTPSKTADEQDEYMKENWFLFYHWLSNPATEKEGGAK